MSLISLERSKSVFHSPNKMGILALVLWYLATKQELREERREVGSEGQRQVRDVKARRPSIGCASTLGSRAPWTCLLDTRDFSRKMARKNISSLRIAHSRERGAGLVCQAPVCLLSPICQVSSQGELLLHPSRLCNAVPPPKKPGPIPYMAVFCSTPKVKGQRISLSLSP